MNYITKVDRLNGQPTRVEVQVNGIYLAFIRGKDGKPREVSRRRCAMVYDQSAFYVPSPLYCALLRQVYGVFAAYGAKS